MSKVNVLFVSVENATRSQIAKAYLEHKAGDKFEVDCAGLEPVHELNPLVEKVLEEDGVKLQSFDSNDVFELFKQERPYLYVITVCDSKSGERCPIFPGMHKRLHWDIHIPDPNAKTEKEQIADLRQIRDDIKSNVKVFINKIQSGEYKNL